MKINQTLSNMHINADGNNNVFSQFKPLFTVLEIQKFKQPKWKGSLPFII